MKSSPVRELARRYAAGELSQENYRSQRRALIDSIIKAEQPLVYRDRQSVPKARTSHTRMLVVLIFAALFVGIATGVAWKVGMHTPPAMKPASVQAAVPAPAEPGANLIRNFVETNDWTDPSLDEFVERWSALTADEQDKARSSLLYPRLVSTVRQQITSEKAIAGLSSDAGNTDAHLIHLQKLAQALGIRSL